MVVVLFHLDCWELPRIAMWPAVAVFFLIYPTNEQDTLLLRAGNWSAKFGNIKEDNKSWALRPGKQEKALVLRPVPKSLRCCLSWSSSDGHQCCWLKEAEEPSSRSKDVARGHLWERLQTAQVCRLHPSRAEAEDRTKPPAPLDELDHTATGSRESSGIAWKP